MALTGLHYGGSEVVEDMNNTINILELIDVYTMLHPTMIENTFFSSARATFIWLDHMVGYSKYLKITKIKN